MEKTTFNRIFDRERLSQAKHVGCITCLKTMSQDSVVDFDRDTPLCPHCGEYTLLDLDDVKDPKTLLHKANECHKLTLKTSYGESEFKKAKFIGCYYCGNEFDFEVIDEYVDITTDEDEQATPFCPLCSIDSVTILDDYPEQKDRTRILDLLHQYSFK